MMHLFSRLLLWSILLAGSIYGWSQPYDEAVLFGQNRNVQPDYDSVQFCSSYLPLAALNRYSEPSDVPITSFIPYATPDFSAVNTRSVSRTTSHFGATVFTDPDETRGLAQPWLLSNGTHTWDSTGRRITRYSLAPFQGENRGGNDDSGIAGSSQQVILPVRDTPGVFRHLILEWSTIAGRELILGENTYDLLLNYRLDARADWQAEVADRGAGEGSFARYPPNPSRNNRDHVDAAVVWQGDARSFEIDYIYRPLRDSLAEFPSISTITAVAHGNGRDWWIIALGGQQRPRLMASFLLEGSGELSLVRYDTAAIPFSRQYYSFSSRFGAHLVASQQGDRLALHVAPERRSVATVYGPGLGGYQDPVTDSTNGAGLVVWDFDRCTGEWELLHSIDIPY